ncbi:MAG: hypothetical protein Q7W51_01075 [Coriobacteriia bacterium]|nr:hypothetical protein [Coriobacteriia bacterium]
MDGLTLDDALELARTRGGHRISLVMPTHRFSPGSQEEDTTRLRNLLRSAADALAARGVKPAEIVGLLAPAQALSEDRPFWLRSTEGLVLLIGPEGMRTFRLERAAQESVVVNDRYHLRPVLDLIGTHRTYWLLSISQKHVRLFEGSRAALTEVPAEHVPESLSDAMQWDDFEKASLQFHSGSGSRGPAIFHGTGETPVKDQLVRFFRAIDGGLHDHLRDSDAPLILAGVDYLLPLYRDTNTYRHLAVEAITGNTDSLTTSALHARATEVADHLAEEEYARLVARIEEAWGSSKITPDPETIVPAAHHGRVETLLLADEAERHGTYDADSGRVTVKDGADGEDLLDLAALHTLENGGRVVSLPGEQMPHGADVVAVLRY